MNPRILLPFRGFALAAALAAYALAVLGSWVRINGAGLTCPDWPLCNGALVPALHGGVLLEWSHRAVALGESLLVLAALVAALRARKRVPAVVPTVTAIVILFLFQVALGAATVRLGNNPPSVTLHWATGMAFLAALTVLAALAFGPGTERRPPSYAAGLLCGAVLLSFAAMCAGAFVSSSGAGLACPAFPGCGASPAPPLAAFAQMVHRALAVAFFATATGTLFLLRCSLSPALRAAILVGYALVFVQIALGVANVLGSLPLLLREAHAANAGATFVAYVIAATRAQAAGAR